MEQAVKNNKIKKLVLPLLITTLLTACGTNQSSREVYPSKDENAFNILVSQFANNIENIWGLQEVLIAGSKDYVKYTDEYRTRSHINFDSGVITIETIVGTDAPAALHHAIIATLLMSDDPTSINLYSGTNNIPISTQPFLYGQVLDNENQPIRWEWRAKQFADYLIENKLQKRVSGLNTIWSVSIKLVPNHLDKRAHKYLDTVRKYARKYQVDEALILAVMETESSFNPYAVSSSDALGLMQVMQKTAGRDVFKLMGKSGYPSKNYLFDPDKNIEAGTAYLSILQDQYLQGIEHPTSKRYAVITAYNGGAGSVLRVFSSDRNKAPYVINGLSPDEVYKKLNTKHPAQESRNYLVKVDNAYKKYRH